MRNSTKMFDAKNAGKISKNNNHTTVRTDSTGVPEYHANSCTYTVFREKMKIRHSDTERED